MSTYQKPSAQELRQQLTPEQYQVTQQEGTELPFRSEYWNNHAAGIYVDVSCDRSMVFSSDLRYHDDSLSFHRSGLIARMLLECCGV
jgi:peptide methionine sulfoxide reductase MsrB